MSEVKLVKDPKGEGKKQTVVINGKPFWEWGFKEHQMWQMETRILNARIDALGATMMRIMARRQ